MDGEVDGSADLRPCDARRGASGRCTRAVTVRSVSHPGHARASYLILWRAAAVTRVIKTISEVDRNERYLAPSTLLRTGCSRGKS